ncbi:MAG: response regulator [Agriterribacter sp.]
MSRVIIYDDDKDILTMTATVLELDGHEIAVRKDCNSLDEDLAYFRPEVILMDNWLPGMKGVDAIRSIKNNENFTHIPIVFFSANSNSEQMAREAGAEWLLNKPFDMDDLLDIVKKAVKNTAMC